MRVLLANILVPWLSRSAISGQNVEDKRAMNIFATIQSQNRQDANG